MTDLKSAVSSLRGGIKIDSVTRRHLQELERDISRGRVDEKKAMDKLTQTLRNSGVYDLRGSERSFLSKKIGKLF